MSIETRRKREREARRTLILDAAEHVMAERGFWGTTMEDVAAAAELSKGALYLYFTNKDALCAALAVRCMGSRLVEVCQAAQAEGTGLRKLEAILRADGHFLSSQPHVVRIMVSWMITGLQSVDNPELGAYRQCLASKVSLTLEAIEQGHRDGTIRRDVDPRLMAVGVWTGLLGTLLGLVSREDMSQRLPFAVEAEKLVTLYIENTLRGLRPSVNEQRGPAHGADDTKGGRR